MIGKLDPEENVMEDLIAAKRKAIAVCNQGVVEELYDVISKLGWDCYDDVVVEIGGTQVSGIHQGENYNKKWAAPYGDRKYNKDAFIVIKNRTRSPFEPSKPFSEGEFKPHHIMVAGQEIPIQQEINDTSN